MRGGVSFLFLLYHMFFWDFMSKWPSVDGSHAGLPCSHQLGQLGVLVTDQGPMAGYPDMPGEAWLRVQQLGWWFTVLWTLLNPLFISAYINPLFLLDRFIYSTCRYTVIYHTIVFLYIHGIAVRLGDFPRIKRPFVEGKLIPGEKLPSFNGQNQSTSPRKAVDVAVLEGLRSMRLRKRPIMGPKEARGTLTNQGWEVGKMQGSFFFWVMALWWRIVCLALGKWFLSTRYFKKKSVVRCVWSAFFRRKHICLHSFWFRMGDLPSIFIPNIFRAWW